MTDARFPSLWSRRVTAVVPLRDHRPCRRAAAVPDAHHMSKPVAVADVMTKDVLCVHPYATFDDIVRLLARYRVHALPVVDADHRVLGIVSEADLSRTPRPGRAHRVLLPGHRRRSRARAGRLVAQQLMSAPLLVEPATQAGAVAQLLVRHGVRQVVVVDASGRLVGVVSRRDLVAPLGLDAEIRFGTLPPEVDIPRPRHRP